MALSPMMRHYLEVKEKHPDALLFYRLGDFYEMFFDDAIKASSLLDLTLTGRDCGLEERAPMCGIPFHASDVYIAKLVALGEKVAICEQLTEPKKGELVKRDVVRVVTAGTIIENELIDEKKNNFIACVSTLDEEYGISWADITTGEFFVKTMPSSYEIIEFLVKLSPAEIISDEFFYDLSRDLPFVKHGILPKFYLKDAYSFNFINAEEELKNHFSILTLEPFNITNSKVAVSCSGALISYLKETQKHSISNLINLVRIEDKGYMDIDVNAVRNLELIKTMKDDKRYGSLLWLLDKTRTGMGARKLQSLILAPLNNVNEINKRLESVEFFAKNALIRQGVADMLKSVKDIARLTGRISNGNLNPRDCLALCASLEVIPSLKFHLTGAKSTLINELLNEIADFSDITTLLSSAINPDAPINLKDGGFIKNGYNQELDELKKLSKNGQILINEIENREREATGIKTLRIRYNRVFGYYIEVTNSFKDLVPYHYQRRQTIANAERYVTEELKEVEDKILNAEEKSIRLEQTIFTNIKATLFNKIAELSKASDAIAMLDVLNALSFVAKENNYVKPTILDADKPLNIVNGRHPVVEAITKDAFVPNDTIADKNENNMLIITGPNMAGKSTYMRQVALITIMAHIGSFVPAQKAEIPLTDKVFTRIGASDNLIFDQSTFMV
ncbi:MAG: DNA mismatch repair protein MutS, partial [Clostridia bacterium]|nr:DNA mismatch repair protein MutS [Clostridia bacterium]